MPLDDIIELVEQIVAFLMRHNAEPEVVDLLMEVEDLDLLVSHVDKTNVKRTCNYLTSSASCSTNLLKYLFEWFEGDPASELLSKVIDLYGLDSEVIFRNVTVSSENRPHPLSLGTTTQIGVIPTEGIPCLLKVLLPLNCSGLPALYVRDLLLNPTSYEISSTIQATCRLMSSITCSIPGFTCVSPAKLVKLLELREANHIEFCRIKNVLDEILHMHKNSELGKILKLLMDPTWVASGLKIDLESLIVKLEREVVELRQSLNYKTEKEAAVMKVLKPVEQEQKVADDSRISVEQEAIKQKHALCALQENYDNTMSLLAEMEKKVKVAESMLEATLQYESSQAKVVSSPRLLEYLF